MADVGDSSMSASYMFRGVEYVVTMNINDGNVLEVEVEDRMTADQWKGTFDAAYIEDLTHKTGNFKQFMIFVNMLESALTEASDSVSLDLLTYADLESLRQRKLGAGPKPVVQSKLTTVNSKRYLILTYTVEFDRIHYPLPLPYVGKPDPRILQETVRELRDELKRLKQSARGGSSSMIADYDQLKKDYDGLLEEKEELEVEYLQMKKEIQNSNFKGPASKEIKVLKTVVKNLEEELLKEKTRHQRLTSKKSEEYRDLMNEIEELRANERNMRVRVKSLTNELNVYKRSRRSPAVPSSQASRGRDLTRRSLSQERSRSRERSYSRDRSLTRNRSLSRDRSQRLSQEPYGSQERRTSSGGFFKGRTPSPFSAAGTRNPRFDPSAYVKEKERKKHEAESKQRRVARSGILTGSGDKRRNSPLYSAEKRQALPGRQRTRSRTSSVGSHGSVNDMGILSDSSTRLRNMNRVLKPGKTSSSSAWDSPGVPLRKRSVPTGRTRQLISTPDSGNRLPPARRAKNKENYNFDPPDSDFFDRSAEISNIDARLNRLQQFMRSNIPT